MKEILQGFKLPIESLSFLQSPIDYFIEINVYPLIFYSQI